MTRVNSLLILMFMVAEFPGGLPAALAQEVVIPEGTTVDLRVLRSVSSDDAKVGQQVTLSVAEAVKVGNAVVIPTDAKAWGVVKEVKAGGRFKGNPRLVVRLESVYAADGSTTVPLRVKPTPGADPDKSRDLTLTTDSNDEPARLAVGSIVRAYLRRDTLVGVVSPPAVGPEPRTPTIDRAKPMTPESKGPSPEPKPQPPAPSEPVMVNIASDPDGAEIEVDGKFVGTTPSQIPLTVGDHKVVISKRGHRRKEYTFTAIQGAKPSLNCELEKE